MKKTYLPSRYTDNDSPLRPTESINSLGSTIKGSHNQTIFSKRKQSNKKNRKTSKFQKTVNNENYFEMQPSKRQEQSSQQMYILPSRATANRSSSRLRSKESLSSGNIVKKFMEMLNCIKIFHWQTRSFAKHKASDELYEELNENIDKFIETLLGKKSTRIQHLEKRIILYNECITGNDSIKNRVFEFCEFLEDMDMYFDKKKDSDLLSIRDDILANLNKFLYLLTFS